RVESPYVARVLDTGGADALPYTAMELLDARDPASTLREPGGERSPPPALRAMTADLSTGLQAAHDARVGHRDLKPHTALRTRGVEGPRWKLVDFGIAILELGGARTVREGIVGTPQYMAPEQATGGSVDERADLYSLSLVVYRALVGRPAFPGRNVRK